MPSLTFQPPNTATVQPVSPGQYASLVSSIQSNDEAMNFLQDGNAGNVSFESVEFAWSYDGVSVLNITITAVHSFAAKLAGHHYIFEQLNEKLLSTLA
jgi:hypothetical protein